MRAVSEHEYGIYNLLYSVIALLSMVFSFGIANTLQRYMPEYYSKGEFQFAYNIYRLASLIRLFSNVIILGLILVLWEQISPILKITAYKQYFMIFTLIIILHMQRGILVTCLTSFFLHKYTHGFTLIFTSIRGICYLFAIIAEKNFWYIISADLLAYIIVFILLYFIYIKKIPKIGGDLGRADSKEIKRITRYSLYYNFNDAGAGLLDVNIDNIIIAMYLNPVAVGAYSFCNRIVKMIQRAIPLNYLWEVLRPAFFSFHSLSTTNTEKVSSFFQIVLKINFIFFLPISFFIAIYGKEIIELFFKSRFENYYSVLVAICFLTMLNSIISPIVLIAQLREKAEIILFSKILGIYNLIADVVLIRYFGIWGAVFATNSALLGRTIFIWYFVRKDASFRGMAGYFFKIIIFWAGISFISFYLTGCFSYNITNFLLGTFIFSICFWLQFRLKLFNRTEQEMFDGIVARSTKLERIYNLFFK